MTVDLNKLKVGYTVKFRCGGEAVIEKIKPMRHYSVFLLFFEGFDGLSKNYSLNGKSSYTDSPFDIIEIIPKAFDWKDIKWGMAFKDLDSEDYNHTLHYVGTCPKDKTLHVFSGKYSTTGYTKDDGLTRTPEHDIKEEK